MDWSEGTQSLITTHFWPSHCWNFTAPPFVIQTGGFDGLQQPAGPQFPQPSFIGACYLQSPLAASMDKLTSDKQASVGGLLVQETAFMRDGKISERTTGRKRAGRSAPGRRSRLRAP